MPTFLVTRNMSPALAARVQAAVSGARSGGARRNGRLKAALRLLSVLLVLGAALGSLHVRRERAQRLERERAELLGELSRHASGLGRADHKLPVRVTSAIALEASAVYAGDSIDAELRDERRLSDALTQPTLYLRGALDGLAQPARVPELAASSDKDAFVLCLVAPPETRSEKALRLKASAAYARGPSMAAAAHFERVGPLLQALPLLGRDFRDRVEKAESSAALHTLVELAHAAPLAAAVRAAKARQLLLVLDEAGSPDRPAELDGERPHAARVALVDLDDGRTRLRFRGSVDPDWLSSAARAQYASGIDSCALALDLRKSLTTLPLAP